MNEVDAAWAAGLFEGEGSIVHGPMKARGGTYRRLSMQMNDEDVLRRFVAIVGAGEVRTVRRAHRVTRENHSTSYVWEINRWADVERILRRLLPYFGERRAQKARELLANPTGPIGRPPRKAIAA